MLCFLYNVMCGTQKPYMGRPGFEPGTNRLKAEYSTVELATRSIICNA